MSERDAFLRTIRANPDDDTARLVFADWLDERDDPLGTFIRVQLELDPVRDRIDRPRVRELLEQEDKLLRGHRAEWLGEVGTLLDGVEEPGLVFARGFPDRVCVSLDTLVSAGATLFTACPTLREVAVFDVQNRAAELANYPLLDRIDTLEIADWPTEADTAVLFASPAIVSRPVLRVWTGASVAQCCLDRLPKGSRLNERIELVQLSPTTDNAVKRFVARFQKTHGRKLTVLRPFDVTFALDSEDGTITVRLPDGRPALLAVQYHEEWAALVIFDEDGNKVQVRRWKRPAEAQKGWSETRAGLRPGLIRLKAFDLAEGVGVSFWSGQAWTWFASPFERDPYQDEHWWRHRGGFIKGWMERGDFVVTFGDSSWANRIGTPATSTRREPLAAGAHLRFIE